MNLKEMTNIELEKLSYLDMAYNIIKFNKNTFSTVELLKEICSVLKYGDKEFEELIGDFYTSLNLDKRFLFLDGKWDLTENHAVKILVEDDLDEEIEDYDDIEEEEIEEEIISEESELLEETEDEIEDDLEELSILDEEEIEEEL